MMKKLFFAMTVALLAFASCNNEELVKETPKRFNKLTATIEPGETNSRLTINQDNTLNWTAGDKIRIFMVDGTTYDYEYQTNGGFEPIQGGNEIPETTANNDVLGVYSLGADDDGDYGDGSVDEKKLFSGFQQNTVIENGAQNRIILPMWGTWNNGSISFKHLAAVLRVNLTDLPADYNLLAVITDQPISGNAYVEDVTVQNAIMKMDDDYTADGDHNLITVRFANASTRTLYVPLPVNTYGSIQVIVSKYDSNNSEGQFTDPIYLANYTNKTVQRAYIYNASPSYTANNATTPAGITSALSATSTQQSMSLTEAIDATANGAGSINIPTTLQNLNLDFEKTPITNPNAPLKIKSNTNAAVGNATQGLNIGMPEDAEDIYMDIDTPTTTATLNGGTYAQITAKTAASTLVIGENTTVTKAIIKGGNVKVYGTLEGIELGDGVTAVTIYKEAGSTLPSTADLPDGVTVVNVAEEELRVAINAASPGSTITLHNDVESQSAIVISKDLTIDMNGRTLTSAGDGFEVTSGTLTICGGGEVQAGSGGQYVAIWANGGNVIINDEGRFSVGADANGNTNDCIYAKGGSITINGGIFSNEGTYNTSKGGVVINAHNTIANSKVVVNAGTFNPANGCVAFEKGDLDAGRLEWYASSLTESALRTAIQNAEPGTTITLGANIDLSEAIVVNKPLTLNMAGYKLTSTGDGIEVTAGGELLIMGDGIVEAGSGGQYVAVWANGGNVNIENGTYSVGADANGNTNDCIYAKGGIINIINGTFSNEGTYDASKGGVVINAHNSIANSIINVQGGTFNPANGCVKYEEADKTAGRVCWNIQE